MIPALTFIGGCGALDCRDKHMQLLAHNEGILMIQWLTASIPRKGTMCQWQAGQMVIYQTSGGSVLHHQPSPFAEKQRATPREAWRADRRALTRLLCKECSSPLPDSK